MTRDGNGCGRPCSPLRVTGGECDAGPTRTRPHSAPSAARPGLPDRRPQTRRLDARVDRPGAGGGEHDMSENIIHYVLARPE
ncbi:hypothetical protein ABWK57_33425, partial [Streptomyces sp. NPDC094045]|uniref:hypothetical protein n=1 Tax=Streptomyces sp. NPDC094045 TaxID=3161019 RepID=UPI003392FDA8